MVARTGQLCEAAPSRKRLGAGRGKLLHTKLHVQLDNDAVAHAARCIYTTVQAGGVQHCEARINTYQTCLMDCEWKDVDRN